MPDFDYREIEQGGIDLVELFKYFWNERGNIAKIAGAFIILGLLIALLSPVEYSTDATLIPETQSTQGRASSLLQQYGGILGIDSRAAAGAEGTISPQLYPNIVSSLPYQLELMDTSIYFSEYDTTTTIHAFFTEVYSPSVLSYLKSYTLGLPSKLIGLFKTSGVESKPLLAEVDRDTILSLNREQMETVRKLRDRLAVSVDQETGILVFSATFPDPRAAAEIAQEGIRLLKEHVKEYRTEKARQNLEFVQEQEQEARKRFEHAQQRLAEFRDSNQNLATAKARSREQELQSQYDLTFNLYNSLSQRLEQAKLALQEDTPVLSILQPVSVPLQKSSPKRLLILVVSAIIGIISGLGWTLIKSWWIK